ncbi:SPOR domain-containing protein [Microbulbifer litoralis]|uniref:SPOR domain-containing protein n=1 Tax=Microbulbifer litoralis TaxID=2933965 RepID=UPI002027AA36|nr:hypothetical protein [Microbulbifer sp. GX H0434]
MRWIVLALLLANIGLFAWFQAAGRAPTEVVAADGAPVPAAGETVELVNEVPAEQLAAAPEKPEPEPEPQSRGEALCTMIGPFGEAYQGEDVAERLRALQLEAELRDLEMQGQMRYWVFLEPRGSRREAFRKLRELQSEGIDSYVIPKGSLTNGISFGIFSESARAEALAGELRERGYPVRTREEPQTYLEQWVVLPPGEAGGVADSFWNQLQLDYPELDRRQNLCRELQHKAPE